MHAVENRVCFKQEFGINFFTINYRCLFAQELFQNVFESLRKIVIHILSQRAIAHILQFLVNFRFFILVFYWLQDTGDVCFLKLKSTINSLLWLRNRWLTFTLDVELAWISSYRTTTDARIILIIIALNPSLLLRKMVGVQCSPLSEKPGVGFLSNTCDHFGYVVVHVRAVCLGWISWLRIPLSVFFRWLFLDQTLL